MKVMIVEVEQQLSDDYRTIVTLDNGASFECLRPELRPRQLLELRSDGAVLVPAIEGGSEWLLPVWIKAPKPS